MIDPFSFSHEHNASNARNGMERSDVDLGEWMNVSMGWLYGNEFESRLDTQL